MVRFGQQRKIDRLQIEEGHVERGCRASQLKEPFGDGEPDAAFPNAGYDDAQPRHDGDPLALSSSQSSR
jgi:hypothetical protein